MVHVHDCAYAHGNVARLGGPMVPTQRLTKYGGMSQLFGFGVVDPRLVFKQGCCAEPPATRSHR
eukprot:7323725-Alexandrium_andersonii.AAC.1